MEREKRDNEKRAPNYFAQGNSCTLHLWETMTTTGDS